MINIKQWWTNEHDELLRLARAAKNPMSALFDMYDRYDALTNTEKKEINELLTEWIEDSDEEKRYTALAMSMEYSITDAIPSMERLCDRFKNCKIPDDPSGYNERELVLSKIKDLKKVTNP